MLRAAICGASGYAGAELQRILATHPHAGIFAITSERSAGRSPADLFPHLHAHAHMRYEPLNPEALLDRADVFFLALPHRTAQPAAAYFHKKGKMVIDLSADYRLADPDTYEKWYNVPHVHRDTLKKAVYGLPELHRAAIGKTRLVANPGCYPTGAILGAYPALKHKLVSTEAIIIDSKSGTSGAGRQADVRYSFCEVNENFKAYAVGTHRHTPEIEQELSGVAKKKITLNFTPHLLPVNRGILTTLYMRLSKKVSTAQALALYKKTYAGEPFVRVLDAEASPELKDVRGTNRCDIGVTAESRTNTLIVITAIDNLIKGAAGLAVQNMNIMAGFPEEAALGACAPLP